MKKLALLTGTLMLAAGAAAAADEQPLPGEIMTPPPLPPMEFTSDSVPPPLGMPAPNMPPIMMISGSVPLPNFKMPELCLFKTKSGKEMPAPCEFEGMVKVRKMKEGDLRMLPGLPRPGGQPVSGDSKLPGEQ